MVWMFRKGRAVCGLVGRGKAVQAGHGLARFGRAWLGSARQGSRGKAGQGLAGLGAARHGSQGSQVPVRYVMDWLGAFCRGAVWQLRQGAIKKKEVKKNGCI